MAKRQQQQYKVGAVYEVVGPAKKPRSLVFQGRLYIGSQEYQVFKKRRARNSKTTKKR